MMKPVLPEIALAAGLPLLRQRLRERLLNAALWTIKAIRDLEQAYHGMRDTWCQRQSDVQTLRRHDDE